MFKQVITEWLDAQKLSWTESGNGYLLCQCPNPKHKDKHPSAFVSTTDGFIKCTSCSYYVSPKTFTNGNSEVADLLLTSKFNQVIEKLECKFRAQEYELKHFQLPPYSDEVGDYRGLSSEFMTSIGSYMCTSGRFEGRIIFPFNNVNDELVGYTGRLIGEPKDKRQPKYMHSSGIEPSNHIIFGDLIKDMDCSTLIVTEGHMDALCLINQGIPATTSLGFRSPSDQWVLESIQLGVDNAVLAWDNDEVGLGKMLDISSTNLLDKWRCKIPTELGVHHKKTKWLYQTTYKDFGEVFEEGLLGVLMM